jgi:hypothetical protein
MFYVLLCIGLLTAVHSQLLMISEIVTSGVRYPSTSEFTTTPKYLLGELMP